MYAKEYFHPFNPTPLRGKPFIIVGPSGVGKNTLVQEILKKYEFFEKKVSYTSRPEKKIKKAGKNYKLISREEFEKVSELYSTDIYDFKNRPLVYNNLN